GGVLRYRMRLEHDRQGFDSGRFELAHDELAVARARPPVDPSQWVSRAVLAHAEDLSARTGPRRRHAGLQLADLETPGERCESREDQRQLLVVGAAATGEQAKEVA